MNVARRLTVLLLLLLSARHVAAQGTVTGQEVVVNYSGTNVPISPPNTPAINFQTNGTNTFIIPVAPTVSLRVYITNNTANACNGAFTIQMFGATDNQTNSFNNSLANWQTILLQSPTGQLVSSLGFNIPASGAAYISSTAISAPKVALQIVNTTGTCNTTNIEVAGVVTTVSVTSPLVSTNGATPLGGFNQVQGVGGNLSSASTINPVLVSGAEEAVNSQFLNSGFDSASPFTSLTTGPVGDGVTVTLNSVPTLTQGTNNQLALGFYNFASDLLTSTFNAGWTCLPSITCGAQMVMSLTSASSGYPWVRHFGNASANILGTSVILTFKSGSVGSSTGFVGSPVPKTVTAGDPLLVVIMCTVSPTPCTVTSVTDTLSNNFAQIAGTTNFPNGAINAQGLFIWGTTNVTNGGADSITITAGGNTLSFMVIELTGASVSNPNQPQTYMQVDQLGGLVVRQDAQAPNEFTCSVTLSTNTTTQCQTIPQAINNVSVRNYVTDFQINTTTAGTATTIKLVTGSGSNCATAQLGLSSILYPNTTVGLTNVIGPRTPLVSPLGTALCVTQAGTTAGTSVVEIRGFFAP